MEYYQNEPTQITHTVDPEPFDLPHAVKLQVSRDKRMRNMINFAMKHFGPGVPVIWSGQGRETTKVVSCVEIMKNNFKVIYQYTRLCEMCTCEVWNPLPIMEGLDALKITRSVPILYILLSLEPLDDTVLGCQKHIQGQVSKQVISELAITTSNPP